MFLTFFVFIGGTFDLRIYIEGFETSWEMIENVIKFFIVQ